MKSPSPKTALALGIVLLTSLVGIFDHDLWEPDEPRAAELGREFLDGSPLAVPTLNGAPFVEKPPFVYWTIALSLRIFGTHDWAARLPAVFFGWGTLFFTTLLARKMYGEETGRGALLILATSFGFLVVTHHIESDVGLLFFVVATAYFLWRAVHESSLWYGAASAAALGAFFSKGLIGFVFPGLLFLTWIAWMRRPRELGRARPWIWLPLLGLPILIWMLALASVKDHQLLRTFLVENHLQRFLGDRGDFDRGHQKPVWYYLLQLPLWFLPWTPVLLLSGRWLRERRHEPGLRFLLSWFGAGFLFLCVAGSKRAVYVVPLLPPLAILAAARIAALPIGRRLVPACAGLSVALAIAWACVVPGLNARLSAKSFCRELTPLLRPATRFYGYDVDETARAVIPFYTGRRFEEIEAPDLVESRPGVEVAVLTQDNRGKDWHSRVLGARLQHLWVSMPAGREHRLRVFSNVERY